MTRVHDPGQSSPTNPTGKASSSGTTAVNHQYGSPLENPPFDPRVYINTSPWGKLRRGRIVEANPSGGAAGIRKAQDYRRLRFLFNPTEIDVSYSLGMQDPNPPLPQ